MLQREALKKIKNLPPDTDTEINNLKANKADNKTADSGHDGLLSADLYTKLISLENYTHPSTHPATMITGLSTVATTGKYSDLSGLPEGLGSFADNIGFAQVKNQAHTHSNKDILDGISQDDIDTWNDKDYRNLTNKPSIPTKVSELTNDSNYVDQTQLDAAIEDISALEGQTHTHTNKPTLDKITNEVYNALSTTRKTSVTTTNWSQNSTDGLYETTIQHGLGKYAQNVIVIATDAANNGEQVFITFTNTTDLNSIKIVSDTAYNADVLITLTNPLNL